MDIYHKLWELGIDTSLIGLERTDEKGDEFTPTGATVIGWECEGIHYCFVDGFGEMVFAVNPERLTPCHVYPVSYNFSDFLRLILACNGTTAIEQAIGWDKDLFYRFLHSKNNRISRDGKAVLNTIEKAFQLAPMEAPYEYIKGVQKGFDYSGLNFSDAFYDLTGASR